VNTAHKIAWRYVKSKKSAQAINIISKISMIAIMFSTAAMITLFSVYNGIEGITKDLYTAFYPDIKITPSKGKFFKGTLQQVDALNSIDLIDKWSYTLEDMALIVGENEQKIATIKGVNQNWLHINNLSQYIIHGTPQLDANTNTPQALIGIKIANELNIATDNVFSSLAIFHPKAGEKFTATNLNAYNDITVQPNAIFRVASMMDDKYVIIPIKAASQLMRKENEFSSIDIKLKKGIDYATAKQAILKQLNTDNLTIEDKYEQNKTLYMILSSEKWAVYAILMMVMLVASFNMIGSLTMLVLEKKHDIGILKSMGATDQLIKQIFLRTGLYLSGTGGILGLALGYIVCFGQQQWGWISMGGGFVVDAYPIAFKWSDFLLVLISVIATGIFASIYPAIKATKTKMISKEE
jgi:lipoprotein-releasing system permease protein